MRVLVVATSTMAQAGLAALVESAAGLEVAAAVSPAAAIATAGALDADICVLDLEGSDDIEVTVASLAEALGCPLVAVAEVGSFPAALAAGAAGVLSPAVPGEALAAALAAVGRGIGVVYPPDALLPSRSVAGPGRDDPPTPGPVEPLTPRELEVLRLLARGLTNQQLAAVLGISEHTAKFHVSAVLGKLGAQSRAEAVALGYRLGLVSV